MLYSVNRPGPLKRWSLPYCMIVLRSGTKLGRYDMLYVSGGGDKKSSVTKGVQSRRFNVLRNNEKMATPTVLKGAEISQKSVGKEHVSYLACRQIAMQDDKASVSLVHVRELCQVAAWFKLEPGTPEKEVDGHLCSR